MKQNKTIDREKQILATKKEEITAIMERKK
jgi:hypothetical protein